MTRSPGGALALAACLAATSAQAVCGDASGDRPVYLGFDMRGDVAAAPQLAEVLARQQVKATFFLQLGPGAGDDTAPWWNARAAEGHGFAALVGTTAPAQICEESTATAERFHALTGRTMPRLFRLANGKSPSVPLTAAAAGCDWVPITTTVSPRNVRAGDVLFIQLGATPWRAARTTAQLKPLIESLKARGLCFATLREHPSYRSQFAW